MNGVKTGRFDRDGFGINYDVLADKQKNSNLLLISSTGSGKSVNLLEKIVEAISIHNARVVIAEVGDSMSLLMSYFSSKGRNTCEYKINCLEQCVDEHTNFNANNDLVHLNFSGIFRKNIIGSLSNPLLQIMKNLRGTFCDDRPTLLVVDEIHLFFNNIDSEIEVCKKFDAEIELMNSFNIWLWLATQNPRDMSFNISRVYEKFEWVEVGGDCEFIIDDIKKVKKLTENEEIQLASLTKKNNEYVEWLLLNRSRASNKVFKYIPKSLSIFLAMSDPMEHKYRPDLMESKGLSEAGEVKIKHSGVPGMFIPDSEWQTLTTTVESLSEEKEALELEIEKVRGEQKYKLKKLSKIIERKDKQLEELSRAQEG